MSVVARRAESQRNRYRNLHPQWNEPRGPVDVALLFAGGARTPLLDYAYLTLTSEAAAESAAILGAGTVVPLHFEQWAHFSEGAEQLAAAFEAASLGDRLRLLKPGESASF